MFNQRTTQESSGSNFDNSKTTNETDSWWEKGKVAVEMCFGTTFICTRCGKQHIRYTRQCDNNEPHPVYGYTFHLAFQRCVSCNSESRETQQEYEQYQLDIDRAKRLMEYMRGELSTPYTSDEVAEQVCVSIESYAANQALHPFRVQVELQDYILEDETAVDEELRHDLEECQRRQREIFYNADRQITEEDIYYRALEIMERFNMRQAAPIIVQPLEGPTRVVSPVPDDRTDAVPLNFLQWTAIHDNTDRSDEHNLRADIQAYDSYLHSFNNEYLVEFASLLHELTRDEKSHDFIPTSSVSNRLESFKIWLAHRSYQTPHYGQANYYKYLRQNNEQQQALFFWKDCQRRARNYRRFLNFHSGGQWESFELAVECLPSEHTALESQSSHLQNEVQETNFEGETLAMPFGEWVEFYHASKSHQELCILTDEERLRDEVYAYEHNYLKTFSCPRQLAAFRQLCHQIKANRVNFDFEPTEFDENVNLMSFREFLKYESVDITDSNDWEWCLTSYQLDLVAEASFSIARNFAIARKALCRANRLELEGSSRDVQDTGHEPTTCSKGCVVPECSYGVDSSFNFDKLRAQASDHHLKYNIDGILESIERQKGSCGSRLDPGWVRSEEFRAINLFGIPSPCSQQALPIAIHEELQVWVNTVDEDITMDESTAREPEQHPDQSLANHSLFHPRRSQLYSIVSLEEDSDPHMFQLGGMRPQWPDLNTIGQIETIHQIESLNDQLQYAASWYLNMMLAQTREAHERLSALIHNNALGQLNPDSEGPLSSYMIRRLELEEVRDRRGDEIVATMAGEEADEALILESERFQGGLHQLLLDELIRTRHVRWDLHDVVDPEDFREANEARDRLMLQQETSHRHRLQHYMEDLSRSLEEVRHLAGHVQMRRNELVQRRDREYLISDSLRLRRQIRSRQGVPDQIRTLLGDESRDNEEDDRTTETLQAENNILREYQRLNPPRTPLQQSDEVLVDPEFEEMRQAAITLLQIRYGPPEQNHAARDDHERQYAEEQQRLEGLLHEASSAVHAQDQLEVRLNERVRRANRIERNLRQIRQTQGETARLVRAIEMAVSVREQAETDLHQSLDRSQALTQARDACHQHLQEFLARRDEEHHRRTVEVARQNIDGESESSIEDLDTQMEVLEQQNYPSSDSEHSLEDLENLEDYEDYEESEDSEDSDFEYDENLPEENQLLLGPAYWYPQETAPGADPFMSLDDLINELGYEGLRRHTRQPVVVGLTIEVPDNPDRIARDTRRRLTVERELQTSNRRATGPYGRDEFARMVAYDHEDIMSDEEY